MSTTRRDFLRTSALASTLLLVPKFLHALDRGPGLARLAESTGARRLIVVQLSGGNDGLNTVIPYRNDLYYKARPTLGIREADGILALEKDLGHGLLRLSLFNEDVTDSLYSQLIPGSISVSRVQNVDAINTKGVEVAYQGNDVGVKGLNFSGSITYADSRIVANAALPDSVGKFQPRVPVWRATALASYRFDDRLSASLGVRYSGDQFSQLNNSDVNGFAYQGASRYLILDVRTRYRVAPKIVVALGIDNLTNETYWNFHPYPQRTYIAELKYDF